MKEVTGSGVLPTTVTAYQLSINEYEPKHKTHESALSLRNGLNLTQILETIKNDKTMNYFVVVGGTQMIEELITAANERSLLFAPRKWILILVEPTPENSKFWYRISPILSTTDVSIARREVSAYSECRELKEGCQMRLAFETLRNAIKKVIELPFYDFNDTKQVKAQTKNRVISEMKVSFINAINK